MDIVEDYRVEPDNVIEGDWHVLTLDDGREVHILTTYPLLIVEPETH